jgi:tRNA acetyltransferase TAN1
MEQLEGIARQIFPKYFKANFNSFQILYKSRYNSKIDRNEVIKVLADIVSELNPLNVVDLTNPKYSIIVEVVKTIICLSVVTDYAKLKKYNLLEAAGVDSSDKRGGKPGFGKKTEGEPKGNGFGSSETVEKAGEAEAGVKEDAGGELPDLKVDKIEPKEVELPIEDSVKLSNETTAAEAIEDQN